MKRIAIALLLAPACASAHAMLEGAIPAVGSTVHAAPPALRLSFSEGLEPRFSSVTVTGAGGASLTAGPIHTDPTDARILLVPVRPLAPGTYSVVWHAVSIDTHRTEGTYHFIVAP